MKKVINKIAILMVLVLSISLFGGTYTYENVKAKTETNKKKVKLNKKKATLRVGESITLKLKRAKAKKVKWSSSKPKVAKVTKKGVVKALKKGTTTITAKYKGNKYKCKIKVKKAINQAGKNVDIATLNQSEYLIDQLYDNKNIIVSPTSLNMVVGMASNGTTGNVKADCETYLGKSVQDYNEHALQLMNRAKSDEMLSIANGIWYDQKAAINTIFRDTVTNKYNAQIKASPLDETTVTEINQWASENTDGMIKQVLQEIPEPTVAILANALLFDGKWTTPFKNINTYKEEFTKLNGEVIKVDMMHSSENIYYENEYAIGFEKTYGDNREYSFIAILPKEEGDFSMSDLDIEGFLKTKTKEYSVKISVPKFSYSWNSSLNSALITTSLKSIYNEQLNPLGNMLDIAESVFVADISQTCKIIVDEEGTKAAAVTTMVAYATSYIPDPNEIKYVDLDRTFGYIIVDNVTNEVLFMGKVVEPMQ